MSETLLNLQDDSWVITAVSAPIYHGARLGGSFDMTRALVVANSIPGLGKLSALTSNARVKSSRWLIEKVVSILV